ncbi:hypothetical protein GOP47_0027285, partial [Adiantum capillus-veneris]
HAKHGQRREAIQLFHQMQLENVFPDNVTFVNTLDLFANRDSLCECKWVHARIAVSGFDLDIVLGTTLVSTYVLGAHEEQAKEAVVVQLYQQMLSESVIPDK